jgi:hypothetical protein
MQRLISKSKFLAGKQCGKLLWTHYNARERIPAVDASTQAIFDQGHTVGRLAQRLVPDGIEIRRGAMTSMIESTQRALAAGRPVYEASFAADGIYCQVDILEPAANGAWNLLEVKSATRPKGVNLHDLAVQATCVQAAGLRIDRIYLVLVNSAYVRHGAIDPGALFHRIDWTDEVRARMRTIGSEVAAMQALIAGPEPDVPIGPHCGDPYECPLKERCWSFLPEHAVTTLHRAGRSAFEWLGRGIEDLCDVDSGELSEKQRIQREAVICGEVRVDRDALQTWIAGLTFPLVMLDFEAFAPAVPLFDGTRPYQPVAFQASAHVLATAASAPVHREFLHLQPTDPRPALVEFLLGLPTTGSLVAWHASYESRILEGLSAAFESSTVELDALRRRLVDLEEPFREFVVHHPRQFGSTSIKNVLPALSSLSYDDEAIRSGDVAAARYLRVVHGWPDAEQIDAFAKPELAADLLRYCAKDTLAMVEVWRALEGMV